MSKVQLRRVGIVIDKENPLGLMAAKELIEELVKHNIEVLAVPHIAGVTDKASTVDLIPDLSGDLIVTIGGDGTMLKTFLLLKDKDIPVMGFGFGERNFLSAVTYENYRVGIKNLIELKFYIRQEMRLDVEIEGRDLILPPVLNDVVFITNTVGKTIHANLALRNEEEVLLWSEKCDGVIVSTPIGSTAYSLAAGGPIVDANLNAILITPLLPLKHTPPLVIEADKNVVLWASKRRAAPCIILDGQIKLDLKWDEKVIIKKSKHYANIVVLSKKANIRRIAKSYEGSA
ncbi:MAG: NAD(+)/NADH kinase [Candidatus Geothermarchaeota archaeon]